MTDLETLAELPSTAGYDPTDRYNEFRRVFMGSEEGKRVFAEILSWAHMLRPSIHGSPLDMGMLAVKEGERNIGLKLFAVTTREPPLKPTTATRKR